MTEFDAREFGRKLNDCALRICDRTFHWRTCRHWKANLLWNDGISGDGFFDGDLYELIYVNANLDDLAMFRVSEYLNAKYGGIY